MTTRTHPQPRRPAPGTGARDPWEPRTDPQPPGLAEALFGSLAAASTRLLGFLSRWLPRAHIDQAPRTYLARTYLATAVAFVGSSLLALVASVGAEVGSLPVVLGSTPAVLAIQLSLAPLVMTGFLLYPVLKASRYPSEPTRRAVPEDV